MPTRSTYYTSRTRSTARSFGGRSGYGSTTYRYGTTGTTGFSGAGWSCSSPKFKPVRNECAWRIGSYRAIYSQCTGTGSTPAFSPTTASKWIRFVNSGTPVYSFTTQQFTRYFGSQFSGASPTSAFRALRAKYGTGIKAVTRGKGGTWLVAATTRVTARPFSGYTWQ